MKINFKYLKSFFKIWNQIKILLIKNQLYLIFFYSEITNPTIVSNAF